MPELSNPDVRFRDSFLVAMAEFADEGRTGDGSMIGSDLEELGESWESPVVFEGYVDRLRRAAVAPMREGYVLCTTWWWTEGEEYVGRICIRHELTPWLLEQGGHIGYDVRRSRRRQGHATAMLAAVLPEARALGLDRVLITCDADNVASQRVIEANGGVLEDQRGDKLRYWAPTPT